MIKIGDIVRLRDETDTSTLFQFNTTDKILDNGSLSPKFRTKIRRNKRLNAVDILHKKGISNREFDMVVSLSGDDRFTNLTTLSDLAEAQTTVYLDTEGIHDSYNGKYDFISDFDHNIDEFTKIITVTFRLIQNSN